MNFFRRSRPAPPPAPRLDDDPRWRRFLGQGAPCACCGRTFEGVFDVGLDHPDAWPHGSRAEAGVEVLQAGDDELSSEYCRAGGMHFLRTVLILPIAGSDRTFGFTCWGSLSDESWERYLAASRINPEGTFDGCFSWLANALPTFAADDPVPCDLLPGPPDERPRLAVRTDAAELHAAQREGISFDRLLDIYAATGTDLRPHLAWA